MQNRQPEIAAAFGLAIASAGFALPPTANFIAWLGGIAIVALALVQSRARRRTPLVVGEVYSDWTPSYRTLAVFCYVRVANPYDVPMSFHSFQLVLERGGDRYQFRANLLDGLHEYPSMMEGLDDPSQFDIRSRAAADLKPNGSTVGYLAGLFEHATSSDLFEAGTRIGVSAKSEDGNELKAWVELTAR